MVNIAECNPHGMAKDSRPKAVQHTKEDGLINAVNQTSSVLITKFWLVIVVASSFITGGGIIGLLVWGVPLLMKNSSNTVQPISVNGSNRVDNIVHGGLPGRLGAPTTLNYRANRTMEPTPSRSSNTTRNPTTPITTTRSTKTSATARNTTTVPDTTTPTTTTSTTTTSATMPTTTTFATTTPTITTTPDETTPGATTPDETTPDETTPDATTPDETTPDETTPDETTPDETTPDATTPDETTPDATPTITTTPDETTSDATTPKKVPRGDYIISAHDRVRIYIDGTREYPDVNGRYPDSPLYIDPRAGNGARVRSSHGRRRHDAGALGKPDESSNFVTTYDDGSRVYPNDFVEWDDENGIFPDDPGYAGAKRGYDPRKCYEKRKDGRSILTPKEIVDGCEIELLCEPGHLNVRTGECSDWAEMKCCPN